MTAGLTIVSKPSSCGTTARPSGDILHAMPNVQSSGLAPDGSGFSCTFCGLSKRDGVAGETPDIFACDDCIALMVDIRHTELGDDAWPHLG